MQQPSFSTKIFVFARPFSNAACKEIGRRLARLTRGAIKPWASGRPLDSHMISPGG